MSTAVKLGVWGFGVDRARFCAGMQGSFFVRVLLGSHRVFIALSEKVSVLIWILQGCHSLIGLDKGF